MRLVVAGVVAVLVVGAGCQSPAGTTPPPAAAPSVAAPAPASVVIATVSPASAGVRPLGAWSTRSGPELPGTLTFVDGAPGRTTIRLSILAGKRLRTATVQVGESEPCAASTMSFSPDAAFVAWVPGDPVGGGPAPLVVTTVATGQQKVYDAGVGCEPPNWLPDSRHVAIRTERYGVGSLDVTTGGFTGLPETFGGYTAWSPDGSYRAYGANGEIVVERADGSVVQRRRYDIGCCTGGFTVQDVSADGRYVGVSFRNSDPSPVRGAAKVVDVNTGREVAIVVGEGGDLPARDVHFLANGGMLVRTFDPAPGWLHVLDSDRAKLGTLVQPAPGRLDRVIS
jgi:hypothetical protein